MPRRETQENRASEFSHVSPRHAHAPGKLDPFFSVGALHPVGVLHRHPPLLLDGPGLQQHGALPVLPVLRARAPRMRATRLSSTCAPTGCAPRTTKRAPSLPSLCAANACARCAAVGGTSGLGEAVAAGMSRCQRSLPVTIHHVISHITRERVAARPEPCPAATPGGYQSSSSVRR